MKRFFVLTLLPILALAAGPAPYPVSVNSQSPVVTSLQSYQANERTFRVTFKDGTNAVDLTGYTPRMTWATTNTATNVATSSWAYVVSSTSGVVDFTFTPASMNTNGVFIYEVGIDGLPFVYRQGVFAIISSPQGNGAAALTFTNPASYVATVGSQVYGIGFDQATGAAVLTGSVASAGVITGNQYNAILGGLTISNVLQWGTNPTPSTAIGASYWSTTYGTKVVNMGFTNLDGSPVMNEEGYNGFVLVQNRSGVTISNGSVVAVIPHPGSILAVVPAMANGSVTNSRAVIGVMTHELVNNAIGVANNFGEVGGMNTASMLEGTEVWLSTNGNGRITTNYIAEGQVAPFHIGFVSRSHATEGRIFVNVGHHEDDPHWAAESNNYAAAISARLASNVWSTAASTTNYVARTGGRYTSAANTPWSFVYAGDTASLSVSSAVVSASFGGPTIRMTTDGVFLDDGMYFSGDAEGLTNLPLAGYAGSGLAFTGGKLVVTNSSGGGSGSFTNLGIAGSNFTTRAYLTAGSNISFRMNATGATIDATGLATGTPLYVEMDSGTNVAARLDSNVWAAADSTTNYISRINAGIQTADFALQSPDTAHAFLFGSANGAKVLGNFEVGSGSFIGDGVGITGINGANVTNMPLTSLRITNTASAGQVLATSNGTNGYWATPASAVSLTTSAVVKLSAMPGAWAVSSDVPTNGGGAIAFEQPFSTSTIYRASFRTISTSAVSRVIQGGPVTLSSVETNWLWFDIDHVGTNAATIQFTAAGATSVLFSANLTTTGVYRISGTNAAGNRELVPYLYTTNTGPGTTNFSRTWLPVIKAVVQ